MDNNGCAEQGGSKGKDGSSQSVATLCGRLITEESMAIVGDDCLRAGRKRDVVSSGSTTSSPATPIPPEVEVQGSRCVAELLTGPVVLFVSSTIALIPIDISRTWLY
jgi:hypothetical protein